MTAEQELCEDCPPVGYPTEETRCLPCPRRGTPTFDYDPQELPIVTLAYNGGSTNSFLRSSTLLPSAPDMISLRLSQENRERVKAMIDGAADGVLVRIGGWSARADRAGLTTPPGDEGE